MNIKFFYLGAQYTLRTDDDMIISDQGMGIPRRNASDPLRLQATQAKVQHQIKAHAQERARANPAEYL